MIAILLGIALKSLLIAGLALGALALLKRRSAAERSWVAHVGLLALLVLALAPIALPRWTVETPALTQAAAAPAAAVPDARTMAVAPATRSPSAAKPEAPSNESISPTLAATIAYALPALLLLIVTLIAVFRLVALRARADVLIDPHWLSALARAQRRMGFKHGTALLTSNDLASPISWGLMRPVILLNARAVEASGEAEAIIAHELAHVARMDWLKLLLARVTTALFWFNPLVWLLAREAHQLREEAADDSVLGANIRDTDYAQLLVGVARHECPGLLLGAHGVAPAKGSLARRVARVLDGRSIRGPVARSFALGVLAGAVLVAAPLAALTLTPAKPRSLAAAPAHRAQAASAPYYQTLADEAPADLPSIIASGVTAAVDVVDADEEPVDQDVRARQIERAIEKSHASTERAVAAAEAAADLAAGLAEVDDRSARAAALRNLGVTPEYIRAMRAAVPSLRGLEASEFAGMRAVGVTPEFARAMASVGFRNLDEETLTSARAAGLDPAYAQALTRAGVRPDIDDYVSLRALGVPASFVANLRASGRRVPDADAIAELWLTGTRSGARPAGVPPPLPPRLPVRPPPDPDDDG